MGLQADLKDAIDEGRDDLIQVLAEHRIVPTVVERSGGSSLLGKTTAPIIRLDSADRGTSVVDRQTTAHVVDALGLDSEEDCERVRDEIGTHSAWG